LFCWIGLFDMAMEPSHQYISKFQSLFCWIGLFDFIPVQNCFISSLFQSLFCWIGLFDNGHAPPRSQ